MLFGNPNNQAETDKALANICEDLKPILERELAAGNRVLSCTEFDNIDHYLKCYLVIQLGRRMNLDPATLPDHLRYLLVRDPHYWWSEVACNIHHHLILDSFSEW